MAVTIDLHMPSEAGQLSAAIARWTCSRSAPTAR
jgi:hypothetical protein